MEASLKQTLDRLRIVYQFPGLERLICVALADEDFADQLLLDPASALAQSTYDLQLASLEYTFAISVTQATTIHDYAAKLYEKVRNYKDDDQKT